MASATGREIEAATGAGSILNRPPTDAAARSPADAHSPPHTSEPSALFALLIVATGVVCLIGAVQSFTTGRWPAFMPPQLDLFAVPLGWLSERLGAWVGAALAAVFGLVCVVVGLFGARRSDAS